MEHQVASLQTSLHYVRRVSDLRHLCQTTSFSFIIKAGDLKEFPLNIEGGRYCVAQLYPKMGLHLFVIKAELQRRFFEDLKNLLVLTSIMLSPI